METMTSTLPPIPEMERAYRKSDASYDGIFFLGVRTTGIFCKPSCPARKPMPENVEYYPTPREAVFAGYRPCKRCRPLDLNDTPEWAERLFEAIEKDPSRRYSDASLRQMGIEPARSPSGADWRPSSASKGPFRSPQRAAPPTRACHSSRAGDTVCTAGSPQKRLRGESDNIRRFRASVCARDRTACRKYRLSARRGRKYRHTRRHSSCRRAPSQGSGVVSMSWFPLAHPSTVMDVI